MNRLFAPHPADDPARAVIFMSGGGSDAEAVLQYLASGRHAFRAVALTTDAPLVSRARELGKHYQIPVVELDLKKFYRERGEESIRLDSPRRCAIVSGSPSLQVATTPFSFIPKAGNTG